MHISYFRVLNYKSFRESQPFEFVPGFNLVLGQNNVGKTALLEALSLRFQNKSHRSLTTAPRITTPVDPFSMAEIWFHFDTGEAMQFLLDRASTVYLPSGPNPNHNEAVAHFEAALQSAATLKCTYRPGFAITGYFDMFKENAQIGNCWRFDVSPDRRSLVPQSGFYGTNVELTYGSFLADILRNSIYVFRAERLNLGLAPFGERRDLAPDARNLAEVLHNLETTNAYRYRILNAHVRTIFPDIQWVAVPPARGQGGVEISVWPIDPQLEREDLAIPLAESGTGIGQVLAILYVVLNATSSRTIVIDEPQSFLHPGAVRKLMDILKQYPQHQYIITTHSSEVVSATAPRYTALLRKDGFETVMRPLDVSETQSLGIYLSEVGVRLSDVFGADAILWVEGPTEEKCFQTIVEGLLSRPLLGTKILGVVSTGDFEGRYSARVLQIYDRLSVGYGIIPPALAFIFDREGRSEAHCSDLIRRSGGKVRFLSRRMYENYLLNPDAIVALLLDLATLDEPAPTVQQVTGWLGTHKWERGFFDGEVAEEDRTDEYWLSHVHGAKLLNAVFTAFAAPGVRYLDDKVGYGFALTCWLIQHAPSELGEIANLIDSLLGRAERDADK